MNSVWGYRRPDNNIFASLSVCFVLDELASGVAEDEQVAVDQIKEKIIRNLPKYQTKSSRCTYNFYQKGMNDHFPYGLVMNRFRHFKLPDDIDDTSLAFLTQNINPAPLRHLLILHSHQDGVYDTWFGKNMPKEKDACALCNLMYLVFSSGEELNENDERTLAYLNKIIVSGEYFNKPFWVARHYGTVPLIVYHYVRLISKFDIPQLSEAKTIITKKIPEILKNEEVYLNQIILQTSGFKLGLNLSKPSKSTEGAFYSFIGAPFAPLPFKWFRGLASKKWAVLGWKCEAHELALQLENAVCKRIIAEEI
jgi:hypothetical protein